MIEWTVPARLETPAGTLYFNDRSRSSQGTPWSGSTAYPIGSVVTYGGSRWYALAASTGVTPGTDATKWEHMIQVGYMPLDETNCKAERTIRATTDKIPQGDGEIFHRRFRDKTEFTIAVQLWENENESACTGATLRQMYEALSGCLNSLVNGAGRFFWAPSGYTDERMLESCRYSDPLQVSWADQVATVTFKIDSPLPYVIDKTQTSVVCLDGASTDIIMPPFSAEFYPVVKVSGPGSGSASVFWFLNTSVTDEYGTALGFWYDSTRPGADVIAGADYGEISMFNETIYLNGNLANLKPGVLPDKTDFFYLKAGHNVITPFGCDAEFLVNNAWYVA